MRYVLAVLVFFHGLSGLLYALAEPVATTELHQLFIQHIMLLTIDAITLAFLWRCPDTIINMVVKILICASIINHTFGAYNYWSYNDARLIIYDQMKLIILYSELAALFIYGSGQAIKRQLRGARSIGLRKLPIFFRSEDDTIIINARNSVDLGQSR